MGLPRGQKPAYHLMAGERNARYFLRGLPVKNESFLILGGAGLVGLQIARRLAHDLAPRKIVIASLYRDEVEGAVSGLRKMFGGRPTQFEGEFGDVFLRDEFAHEPRGRLLQSYLRREELFTDLFGPLEAAYANSRLVQLVLKHRPDVIVDSINTATALSYQDVYTASVLAKRQVDALLESVAAREIEAARSRWKEAESAFEALLLSQAVPQLIRHVLLLHRATREVGTRLYLKIGTTGTGGMGLNIPYTHSEDRPSAKLMTKTAIAFAHTGLLFLMARTPGGPIVKEIKPGAMIGYADVTCRTIKEGGQPVMRYSSMEQPLDSQLRLRMPESDFEREGELDLPVVDTGENGLFTKGEFEAITSLRQMEFMTPEDIALEAVLEIRGSNTGHDVIAAVDGSVMDPTYRAGYLRQQALLELERLERETATHSVALGQLGPPELSKLLWEAELLRTQYRTLEEVLRRSDQELAQELSDLVQGDPRLRHSITSIGVPVLTPGGETLIRGPFIRIPEVPGAEQVPLGEGDVDAWAGKGWVDLRPSNMARWQERLRQMERARQQQRGSGSAAITRQAYLSEEIQIGSIVGWIFNNEQEGYRIK